MTDIGGDVQTVESVSYRLEDLKSGTVKVSSSLSALGFTISHQYIVDFPCVGCWCVRVAQHEI